MKKTSIILVLLVIIAIFAGADYYLNNLGRAVPDITKNPVTPVSGSVKNSGFADAVFKLSSDASGYKVAGQTETSQIFEKIDLSNIKNIRIYKDQLEKTITPTVTAPAADTAPSDKPASAKPAVATNKSTDKDTIYIYEIHGPIGQGSLTYLGVKLGFIRQIDATTEILNETNEYGQSSFFYNDTNYANIGFLLTQIGDNLYAFEYKKLLPDTFNTIKIIIGNLKMSL
jgi:hypothetical protein